MASFFSVAAALTLGVALIAADSVKGRGMQASGTYCVTVSGSSMNNFTILPMSSPMATNCVVIGQYTDGMFTMGWDVIKVNSSSSFPDGVQAFAAGFFEGAMLSTRAYQYYINFIAPDGVFPITAFSKRFLNTNRAWIVAQIAANAATDPYWAQIGLVWQQFEGMVAGYAYGQAPHAPYLTLEMAYWLASAADTSDLDNIQAPANWRAMKKAAFERWLVGRSHCSVLIKLTATLDNLFTGHATWLNFPAMLRVFKTITLNFNTPSNTARTVQFSSFSGMVSSTDDFYRTSSGLSVVETSLTVFNMSIYSNVHTSSVLSWMRVLVANRMATSGQDWTQIFSKYNSGTYNNEWLVVDYNQFTPLQAVQPGTLFVLDQMPGMIDVIDASTILSYGYVPSYNIPMSVPVFNYAGYPEAIQQQGPEMLDYHTCVRARIFANLQGTVADTMDMQYVMQYNEWQTDPLSLGNPMYAIASRGDLTPQNLGGPVPFGAIDAKITDYQSWRNNVGPWAFSGPTPQQGVFVFSNYQGMMSSHIGMPNVWNFTWVAMNA